MRDNLRMAKRFSNTVRYIDDLLTLNNNFEEESPNNTVEPPLTDASQRWTLAVKRTLTQVPDDFS